MTDQMHSVEKLYTVIFLFEVGSCVSILNGPLNVQLVVLLEFPFHAKTTLLE